MPPSTDTDNLELILFGWVGALRRNAPDAVASHLATDIVWQGLRPDLVCSDRDEVLENIRQGGELRLHVRGLELTAPDDQHVVLGVRLPDVTELFGEPIAGEIYSLFTLRDDVIVRIDEFKTKDEALAAIDHGSVRSRQPSDATAVHVESTPRPPHAVAPPDAAAADALIPFVHVTDVRRSIAFYVLLGFEVDDTYERRGRLEWAALRHAEARLMLAAASAQIDPAQQAVLFYLYTKDLAALRQHLLDHGASPGPVRDGTPGPRQELRLIDPDGYCLMIAQRDD